ncbi:CAP domain-containing protein [Myxococcus sp. XM-1-1-1]|uniref:CAP domain-containing protein n=1 Tax=Myxococcus sp. XM-1-1-1 TaxID=2874602 RepID=UPI001CC124A6|nr:CAP domain-containing protein [Myxococcus sp. XM-1-1-1]MBZ4410710.1 CAP domain-containing protein [Myxococcus sp. XM-1-1-1]
MTSSSSFPLLFLCAALMGGCDAGQTTTPTSETSRLPTDDLQTVESRSTVGCFPSPQESSVLSLINQQRAAGASCGGVAKVPVPPLSMNGTLVCAARAHAQDMATNGYLGYISLDGQTPLRRVTSRGYTPLSYMEENIAAGYISAEAVVTAWMANPRDCNNIMSPAHTHVGVGNSIVPGSTYNYWVQDFGRP